MALNWEVKRRQNNNYNELRPVFVIYIINLSKQRIQVILNHIYYVGRDGSGHCGAELYLGVRFGIK
jgi:hypothetical protein